MFHQVHYLFWKFILGYLLEDTFRIVQFLQKEFSLSPPLGTNPSKMAIFLCLLMTIEIFELHPITPLCRSNTHQTYSVYLNIFYCCSTTVVPICPHYSPLPYPPLPATFGPHPGWFWTTPIWILVWTVFAPLPSGFPIHRVSDLWSVSNINYLFLLVCVLLTLTSVSFSIILFSIPDW